MSGKKKSDHKKSSVEKILLAAAIIQLIQALVELLNKLLE